LRQAFAEEILFGYARVAVPDTSADSEAIVNTIENELNPFMRSNNQELVVEIS
jgi:hypothetical protein